MILFGVMAVEIRNTSIPPAVQCRAGLRARGSRQIGRKTNHKYSAVAAALVRQVALMPV